MIDFGLTPDTFRERYLEREPRLQKLAVRGAPFVWSDLDAVLHAIEPVAPVFQLFNGGLVAEEQYTDLVSHLGAARRRLNKRRFLDQLRSGATLVVNRFEDYSARALQLCNAVGRLTDSYTAGNAYLSIGGRGTFGKHWDTHDVFAIQLIGRKRWQIFPPTFPLPLAVHRSEDSGHACPAVPALDCVLDAGDVLYVPRGWWHHAIPFDEPSLHLSVGTYAPTLHDYLVWVCANRLPALLAARRPFASMERGTLESVLQGLRDAALADATRAEFERIAARPPAPSELDTELFLSAGVEGLRNGATVSLNATGVDPEQTEISINGARLRLHPLSRSIVAALAAGPLSVTSLCDRLGSESADAIRAAVRDLARHDVVTIER